MAGYGTGWNGTIFRVVCVYMEKQETFNRMKQRTGLNFRALPNRTYLAPGENRRDIRGSKAFAAKDRLTLALCVNATGTSKVPPLLVGSSKEPRCFRDGRPPCPYIHQKRAWMDRTKSISGALCGRRPVRCRHDGDRWHTKPCGAGGLRPILSGFAPNPPVFSRRASLLTLLVRSRSFFFPPNCTSVHQSLDQGIISAFKTSYKTEVVTALAESYTSHSLRDASEIPAGRLRVRDAFLPNVLDAANLVKICWDKLPKSTMINCWRHSRCLPHLPSEIGSELEHPVQQIDAMKGICDLFTRIELYKQRM